MSETAGRDMRELDTGELREIVGEQPYPLLFATVSGAHLYGFASRDSDVDLRGAHVLPAEEVLGLTSGPATLDALWTRNGAEIDLVTHDAAKFFRMLLQRNGYVLEQLLSPLVVVSGEVHQELVALAPGCLTRHHAHHYRGFAQSQRRLFGQTGELKPLLYTFRILLTGIHLMRTGRVEASLPPLLPLVPGAPAYLPELIEAKTSAEHALLSAFPDLPSPALLDRDLDALEEELAAAEAATFLPERPSAAAALHDLLIRLRLGG